MRRLFIVAVASVALCSPVQARHHHHHGGRVPWCGIYMSQYTGIHKEGLARARNWAYEGENAGGPGAGVIVVWPHHVGIIVGHDASGWVVHSGNDGNAVRTRVRSLAGVIAYRRIGAPSFAIASYAPPEPQVRRRGRTVRLASRLSYGGVDRNASASTFGG